MSQFYARYIPPERSGHDSSAPSQQSPKRKLDDSPSKPSKHTTVKRQKTDHYDEKSKQRPSGQQQPNGNDLSGGDVLKKYSVTKLAQRNVNEKQDRKQKKEKRQAHDEPPHNGPVDEYPKHRSHISKSKVRKDAEAAAEDLPDSAMIKHTGIMSRFEKSKVWSAQHRDPHETTGEVEKESEDAEMHGLEPISQPQASDIPQEKPSFSILAPWQSNALRVDHSKLQPFSTMKLSGEMLANLRKNKIEKSFPVQSTVIPMLLDDEASAMNDLCVSAATGSGKTLAYVIPIVEDLRRSKMHRLRAVIVVPTRELVQQVKDTCEVCAAGSGLRIVTAVGSKSLKEEQEALIEEEEIYNPKEYQLQQDAPIDWTTFDLGEEIDKARSNVFAPPAYYITQRRITADILITTPGRLVDHLKNTTGFHLDDITWLVIDEADRLLNESYQEWIETVMPALRSRNATKARDTILRSMRMDLPPRIVRKVLLSATMTRDISKLNALELRQPKLIVLNSSDVSAEIQSSAVQQTPDYDHEIAEVDGAYQIPTSLQETVLAFIDGSHKPMILLQLLVRLVSINSTDENTRMAEDADIRHSSSSDDDSDDSTTTDSDSDSDSDTSTSASSDTDTSTSASNTLKSAQENSHRRKEHKRASDRDNEKNSRVLIFTKSTASASRLSRLLALMSPNLASEMTTLTRSATSSSSSKKALSAIRSGKIKVLIATDRASRGIDVPGLENVINYDIPASALTYVHRVGRTARAGSQGHAWSLVEHREGRWFWNEIGGKSKTCAIRRTTKVRKQDIKIDDAALEKRYENALQKLGEEVRSQ